MVNFIKLTDEFGKKVFVNIDVVHYLGVLPYGVTFLNFNEEDHCIKVKETPEQIIAKMKEARGDK